MQTEQFIPADLLQEYYNIELSFIHSLQEYGLIEVTTLESKSFIDKDKLPELEKFIHLHYDLEINFAGIDALTHLLQRVRDLQDEINTLKNKLHQYE